MRKNETIFILLNMSKKGIKNKTKYEYESRYILFRNAQFIQKLALMF